MILQALYDYYERKSLNPEGGIAPEGCEWKSIPFLIVINREGRFITIEDTREGKGKTRRSTEFLVQSLGESKGNGIKANLLWENVEYFLGIPSKASGKPERIQQQHQEFRDKIQRFLSQVAQPDIFQPVLEFYRRIPLGEMRAHPLWDELCQPTSLMTFRIDGVGVVTDLVEHHIELRNQSEEQRTGFCLVTGRTGTIARLHPPIKGVRGANSFGASIVAVNNKVENGRNGGETPAFASYMKQQGYNSPILMATADAYTKSLNSLLASSHQNIHVGDASTVFWAERKTGFENHFAALFGFTSKDDPDSETRAVKALYESAYSGNLATEGNTRFFVLGLAPNAARISVRFWHQDTLAGLSDKLRRHLDDLEIVLSPKDPGHRALMHLLCSLVLGGKADNIPPNLAGAVVCAVLSGGPYPQTLLQLAVRRIRAERTVTRARAAVLKAVLNRTLRQRLTDQKEITVSLDLSNLSPGYRLGRLFAVLEKIQEDAQPGINATIRDRFYGAASSSPASVFPQLLKLKNHHLAKLANPSFRGAHEKRLGEIFDGIVDMPPHLAMEEQARFAIGYYHQRQALFTKSAKPENEPQA